MAPLQKVAVTADSSGLIRLAGGKAQHDSLDIGRTLRIPHRADSAHCSGPCLLDLPYLHFPAERYVLGQRSQIAAGGMDLFQLDVHFEGFVENLMVKRLTMSRIG